MKDKNEQELHGELEAVREKLRAWRFAMTGSKTKNVKEGKGFRKDIARILTELNSRKKNTKV
ncbi:MAG: 50S ribosomal protein L29 [bacterium]|nr:50S ribosomal protein L29 [bacterium]